MFKKFFISSVCLLMVLTLFGCEKKQPKYSITEGKELVGAQVNKTFPLKVDELDDTLIMNTMAVFKTYRGQGLMSVDASKAESFTMKINGYDIDTSKLVKTKANIDFKDLALNGNNTVMISNIKPDGGEVVVKIDYPQILDESEKYKDNFKTLDTILNNEVEYGFPSGSLVVIKDGKIIKNTTYGYVNSYNEDGSALKDKVKVNENTLYDLASNTKMYATNYAIQKLVSEEKMKITDKISDYFKEFKDGPNDKIKGKDSMTVQNVLEHQAGFPADPQYHNNNYDKDDGIKNGKNDLFSQNKEVTKEMILKTPLQYEPGSKTLYSDVDYMLLGIIVEKIVNKPLDQYVEEEIYKLLGLKNIVFNPLKKGYKVGDCAATELNGNTRQGIVDFANVRKNTLQCEVHDEKAFYAMNGVSGHAGLFSTAKDLATLAQVMLNGGGYGDHKIFNKNVIDQFIKPKFTNPTYGLGWRRMADGGYGFYFGPQASSSTFGHTGWTGTVSVIDPQNDLIIIWLTNKINSPLEDPKANANFFSANNYLGATYGAVTTLVYEAVKNDKKDVDYDNLVLDMVKQKDIFIQKVDGYQGKGDLQDYYSLIKTAIDHYKVSKNKDMKNELEEIIKKIADEKVRNDFLEKLK